LFSLFRFLFSIFPFLFSVSFVVLNLADEVHLMRETNVIAAILTVAFYTARGPAMSLPQIIATYNEMRDLVAEQTIPKKRKKK
jgi:hypothetical protein